VFTFAELGAYTISKSAWNTYGNVSGVDAATGGPGRHQVKKMWGGHAWRARGVRAYNGDLGQSP